MESNRSEPALLSRITGSEAAGSALAAVLDAMPDGIVVVDHEGRIQHASRQMGELTGYEPHELVGRPVEDLVPEDLRDRHAELREGYARAPQRRPMGADLEIWLLHRRGERVPVDVSLSPATFQGERFTVAALREASARRETEQVLREAAASEHDTAEELREADRLKTNLLRAVSHDLRSPLASMLGLAMTLDQHLEELPPDEVRGLLRRLVRNGQRLDALLADLLDLDHLQRGGVSPEYADLDLVGLVGEVLKQMEADTGDVTLEAPEQLVWPVDAAHVRRIVENLVANALKHASSEAGVTVRLDARTDEVVLSVEDRGRGVPDVDKRRIFEPFVRGEHGSATPGTGVGLSLVAQFAQLHGGRAWVEDRPGGGAVFRVSLPRP